MFIYFMGFGIAFCHFVIVIVILYLFFFFVFFAFLSFFWLLGMISLFKFLLRNYV